MTRCLASLLIAFLLLHPAGAHELPSRDPAVVVPLLRAWQEHGSFDHLEHILGVPDRESISGFSITTFRLDDGSSIYVKATPSHNRIYHISCRTPGALAQTLYSPLVRDLDHPPPHSAPF